MHTFKADRPAPRVPFLAGTALSVKAFTRALLLMLLPALFILGSVSAAYASQNYPLPDSLMTSAVSDSPLYDEDFDYVKLGKISSLPIYTASYQQKKGLVDHVIVNKMHHQMFLMKGDRVVRKYWIALSDRPEGKKQYEGDHRTPEGTYTLDYVKPRSSYYKAFHISYPNSEDIANARKIGRRPGGMIMVHGQPPSGGEYHETVQSSSWTNGCIALLNPEIDEFLSLVDIGTPITINP